MALKALSMDKTIEFQSSLDPDKGTENATVFVIKALSARQVAKIRDKSTKFRTDGKGDETDILMEMHTANYEFVRHGLKEWRNFQDENGNDALLEMETFEGREVVKHSSMDRLQSDVIQELAARITGFNSLEEDEVKN